MALLFLIMSDTKVKLSEYIKLNKTFLSFKTI